jgi:uncharacterized protein (TIGR03083 family)
VPEIIDAMEETLLSLESVLSTLTPEQWSAPTGCPGWDVQDVASHVIGVEKDIAGESRPDHVLPEGLAHVRDDNGRFMELPVDFRRGVPSREILEELGGVMRAGVAARRASDRDPDEPTDGPFGWRMPYWRLLSIRVFDCFAHEQDVRRAVGIAGNLDGKAATIVGGMFGEMLPGILPSRVEELAERRVTISVVDPAPPMKRELEIGQGDEATAKITLPFAELVALVCGRSDVQRHLIEVSGDVPLGERVLTQLAVTP